MNTYWDSKIIGEAENLVHAVSQHPIVYARKVALPTERDHTVHDQRENEDPRCYVDVYISFKRMWLPSISFSEKLAVV